MKEKTIALLISIILAQNISAQTNKIRERFYLEGTYSEIFGTQNFNPTKINNSIMDKQNTFENRYNTFGIYTSSLGSNEQKILSYYAFENSPKPKLDGQNYSIFSEYIFNSGIGLGISINSSDFQAKNIATDKLKGFLDLTLIYNLDKNSPIFTADNLISKEILTPYQTFNDNSFLHVRYLAFQFSYHFLEKSTFDPYIRTGIGFGRERFTSSNIIKTNLAIGSRLFISENYYVLLEFDANNYNSYQNNSRFGYLWSFIEYSGKIGGGMAF